MRIRLGWKRHVLLDACVVSFVVTHFIYPGSSWAGYADALTSAAILAVIWSLWRESRTAGPYTARKGPFSTE